MIKDLGDLFLGIAILLNSLLAALTYLKTLHSINTIKLLEKNTNSIKDALVKVTGEAEHAKGVLMGLKQQQQQP